MLVGWVKSPPSHESALSGWTLMSPTTLACAELLLKGGGKDFTLYSETNSFQNLCEIKIYAKTKE